MQNTRPGQLSTKKVRLDRQARKGSQEGHFIYVIKKHVIKKE